MQKVLEMIATAKTLLQKVTEAGFVFVAFIVLIYLLLGGKSGDFVISVISNISLIVNILTPNVLIGVALVLFMVNLVQRRG